MIFGQKPWSAPQLADHLQNAGFHAGQNVIVHSSLKSVGRSEHGAETIVDALREVIGPDGNLMVPTFTYSMPGWKGDPFDIKTSKARTGTIPEFVRTHPDAVRSFHPTHSVAVLGPDSDAITADHMLATPLGLHSPFHRMLQQDATILMLGTRQDTDSSLHLCEVMAELPYVHVCFSDDADYEVAWYRNEDDQVRFAQIREIPGCSRGFKSIETPLIQRGVLQNVKIGNADCQVLDMGQLVEAALEILRQDPTLLLCNLAHCGICPKRRAFMQTL